MSQSDKSINLDDISISLTDQDFEGKNVENTVKIDVKSKEEEKDKNNLEIPNSKAPDTEKPKKKKY